MYILLSRLLTLVSHPQECNSSYTKSSSYMYANESLKHCILIFVYQNVPPKGGAPFLEVLQYQVDAWSGRSKLLFHLLIPKIHLIYCPRIEDVSDIKLIRTDTTLDLSQKAEKRYW